METLAGRPVGEMSRVDFFTSHEGLHLLYEQAQTRRVPHREGWYNLSTHFPWIGMRTANPDGAHVEYFRGIANPIGVKVGPATTPERLLELLDVLDPRRRAGPADADPPLRRAAASTRGLPPLVEAVRAQRQDGALVLRSDARQHRDHRRRAARRAASSTSSSELEQAFEIHARRGTRLGGVHFELTGENVTECLGGARGLVAETSSATTAAPVDPRLNYEQALEMAMRIARRLGGAS